MSDNRVSEVSTPDDIDDLARRAQDGDRDAMELLLAAVRPRTLNVCRGVLPYTPDAEDACQEALIKVAQKIGTWNQQGRFTTWLHVVAVNSARSTYRRMKNQAIAADPHESQVDAATRPAHHQRHRRHPARPARGDGDAGARPPAVRGAAAAARRLRAALRGDRAASSAPRSGRSRRRSTTAASWCGRCWRSAREAEPPALGALLLTVALAPAAATTRRPRAGRRPAPDGQRADAAPSGSASLPAETDAPPDADDPALDPALSEPVEDSVYPDVGDPSVDSLHYDLDLAWTPDTRTLDGDATIELRSTADADHLQLDLGEPLEVSAVTLDGADVRVRAPRQGPRGQRAGHEGRALRARGPLLRHAPSRRRHRPRAATSAPAAGRSRRRRDVDDAGAVRRVHVVPRQRPALRQGVLRLHVTVPVAVGRRSRTAS